MQNVPRAEEHMLHFVQTSKSHINMDIQIARSRLNKKNHVAFQCSQMHVTRIRQI